MNTSTRPGVGELHRHRHQPERRSGRRAHRHDHLVGTRSETADARDLRPAEAHLGAPGDARDDRHLREPRRGRQWPVRAGGLPVGAVADHGGERALLRRSSGDRSHHLPLLLERRRDGGRASDAARSTPLTTCPRPRWPGSTKTPTSRSSPVCRAASTRSRSTVARPPGSRTRPCSTSSSARRSTTRSTRRARPKTSGSGTQNRPPP